MNSLFGEFRSISGAYRRLQPTAEEYKLPPRCLSMQKDLIPVVFKNGSPPLSFQVNRSCELTAMLVVLG